MREFYRSLIAQRLNFSYRMITVLTVIGARPQFIKASVMSRYFRENSHLGVAEKIIHTGQHYDKNMSEVFFQQLQIPEPSYHLNINNASHGKMTGKMLEGVEEIILSEKPDYLMVYGDTNSTLAGALAAKKLHVNVIHVEAGLRSFNMSMPEEINRILTDRISDVLCCPTKKSLENLVDEGFENFNCLLELTGDIMEDSVRFFEKSLPAEPALLPALDVKKENFILCTLHRQENVDNPERLGRIIRALEKISANIPIIIPLHPRTRQKIEINTKGIIVTEPLSYSDNLQLLRDCKLVMTDSGGLQKEAYFFRKFCVTLRDETEWVELVENGFNIVAGADETRILNATELFAGKKWNSVSNLYGGGNAAEKVCKAILSHANRE